MHVPKRNIIGHFGPIPLNKWFSSTSKMHNSFMQNPNEVKFVTKLNRFERATTFMKELFPFEVHSKSYSRWKKWTFGLVLRKFSNMFDFPNFHLKIHHDPSFKWKKVFNIKVVPLYLTFPKSPRSSHLAKEWRTCVWVQCEVPFGGISWSNSIQQCMA